MLIFVAATGLILLAAAGVFGAFLQDSVDRAVEEQMYAETAEYIKRLEKQIDANFQLLDTLAVFIGNGESLDEEGFSEIFDEANYQNDFLTMAYFDRSGNGITSTLGEGIDRMSLEDGQEEFREVAYAALEGESRVSRLFTGNLSHEKVFVYAVPVKTDGEIRGVLCASDHIEIFSDILTGNQVMGGSAYIHMVNQDGDFLIRSERAIVKENAETLMGEPFLEPDEYDQVREKMHNSEEVSFSFDYGRETYRALLEPVGINGWYLFCINSVQKSSRILYLVTRVTAAVLASIIALLIFWLIYSYRLTRKNTYELNRLAFFDQLTGTYNFPRFRQEVGEEIEKDANGALVSLNIHQFKFINEIFGKERADRLLQHVADTISSHLRADEILCRESADFFYLFLRDTDKEKIRDRLETIMSEACGLIDREENGYHMLMYCGAVISDERVVLYDLEQMMTHVMFALEKARETHQNNVWFFDTRLHEKERMDNYVEGHMYQALDDEEFRLHLQLKKDLKNGHTAGAEALVRWIRGDGTTIYPDQFIPVFEENGFCTKLDMYMVEKVCACIRGWMDQGYVPLPVSVNQSKAALYQADYVRRVSDTAERYGVPAESVDRDFIQLLKESEEEIQPDLNDTALGRRKI